MESSTADLDDSDDASQSQEAPGENSRTRHQTLYCLKNCFRAAVPSRVSVNTVVDTDAVTELPLRDLCTLIDEHQSLQCAAIVKSCTFVEKKPIAPHRFIVLELHRQGRKHIWLRLERKPESRAALVSGIGRTPSNDVVSEATRLAGASG